MISAHLRGSSPSFRSVYLPPTPSLSPPPLLEAPHGRHSEEESGVLLGFLPSCCTPRQHLQLSLLGSWDLP